MLETRRTDRLPGLRIALAVDKFDWHARELTRALASLGARAFPFRLSTALFDTSAKSGLRIRGFNAGLPDAVIVRAISGGTFQAVTMRLGVLHALRELGVPVWNDARAVERCVDKSATSFLLARAGIPTPATWCVESLQAARAIAERELPNGPLVLKPLFGSQGRGLQLIAAIEEMPPPEVVAGVYYLQRFVGVERDGFRDLRLLVLKGRVVAAMVRHADQWITNVKQGGRPVATVPDAEVKRLALATAEAVGADFVGVDIVRDADGRPLVLEANSMPAWRGLQRVTSGNIAAMIVRDLVGSLEPQAARKAAV
jgi:tetrahydromethanopterin:alpha-L-glutamate ligase